MTKNPCQSMRGFTLLEVLITIVILAFGLLGLTNLQTKLHMTEMESYQRTQALILLKDFSDRLQANGANATGYLTDADRDGLEDGEWLGTGSAESCTSPTGRIAIDRCEWHEQLRGEAETSAGVSVGAALGARGCVEEIEARNNTNGSCQAGIYRISIAWQGLYETATPDLDCGAGQYGAEGNRRVIAVEVTVGTPKCL